jgi:outer membrane protein OmpA-like peptidoglycan-associated protein
VIVRRVVARLVAAVLVAALVASGPAAGGVAAAAGRPAPRHLTFVPRTIHYRPRTVVYTPRTIVEQPQQSAPMMVTVGSDILFAFDSAALSPQATPVLASVVTQIQQGPAGQVVVTGYTDSIGDAGYNLTLSMQRAQAVVQALQAAVSRSDVTFVAVGDGEADPVASNTLPDGSDNPAGRAQNRRVTITVP